MSLVGTLAKVAVGIAVAKGLKSVTGGGSSRSSGGGGLGGLLGGALGGAQQRGGSSGGLGDILGQLGGAQQQAGGTSGGLGDILGQLGGQQGGNAGGGIGDLLGGVLGGQAQQGGGLGDLMGGLARGNGSNGGLGGLLGQLGGAGGGAAGGLGGLLTNALENQGQVTQQTSQADEDSAALMIRAMLQAAKADGQIDDAEKEKLLGNLGDLDAQERAIINQELNRGIDVRGLAQDTPRGMGDQVYAMSVMAIDLDTQDEASYLHDLAQNLGLDQNKVNKIHQMMDERPLYS